MVKKKKNKKAVRKPTTIITNCNYVKVVRHKKHTTISIKILE